MLQSAYGLVFADLPAVQELPEHVGPAASTISVRTDVDERRPDERPLDDSGGVRLLADGRLLSLDRVRRTAVFHGPPLAPDLIAHPYLGAVATAFSRWRGRESFHAGAFVHRGRAWGVTGPRTAGKSTLLAALAARGTEVLTDDVLITDGSLVFCGPRCLDLRDVPPFVGLELRTARRGERRRLGLPPAGATVPLGGWFFLSWAPEAAVERLAPATALTALAARRAGQQLHSDPTVMLSLGTAPAWKLRRPRCFDDVPATLALLDRTIEAVVLDEPWSTTGPG